MIDFNIGYATDVGNKRKINQDSIMIYRFNNGALFVIADGMGGMSDGEKVSKIATDSMRNWIQTKEDIIMSVSQNELIDMMYDVMNAVNSCILEYRSQNDVRAGTTMTSLLIRSDIAIFAHSGDSRLYQVRNNVVKQLTEDETLYSYNENNNVKDNYEKNKSILTSYMGKSENLDLTIQTVYVCSKDIYILCSDGFYNYLNMYEDENMEIIKRLPAQESTDILVKKIKATRALDNLSAIIVKICF